MDNITNENDILEEVPLKDDEIQKVLEVGNKLADYELEWNLKSCKWVEGKNRTLDSLMGVSFTNTTMLIQAGLKSKDEAEADKIVEELGDMYGYKALHMAVLARMEERHHFFTSDQEFELLEIMGRMESFHPNLLTIASTAAWNGRVSLVKSLLD